MTDQDQRIALCEWAGFEPCHQPYGRFWYRPEGWPSSRSQPYDEFIHLPDTSSLDVLHEMRQKLTPEQREIYTRHRWKICRRSSGHIVTDNDMWKFANLDAAQERECLLLTLNLWKEDV